jgi:hypothetical protein
LTTVIVVSVKARLVVKSNAEWKQFAFKHTDSVYEDLLKIPPGAFYSPTDDAVYTSQETFDLACKNVEWALKLLIHEFGHAAGWPLEDHTMKTFLDGFKHAVRVGFDVRAFTRFLRWSRGDTVRWNQGMNWFAVARLQQRKTFL